MRSTVNVISIVDPTHDALVRKNERKKEVVTIQAQLSDAKRRRSFFHSSRSKAKGTFAGINSEIPQTCGWQNGRRMREGRVLWASPK